MKKILAKKTSEPRKKIERGGDELRVYISPLTFLMGTVFVAIGMAYEFVCSFTAVILHEFAHATAAKRLGFALNEVKIMPYGAALCGNENIDSKSELKIAAAGPCINLLLGLVFAALWWLIPQSYAFTQTFCLCNMYIGAFNLLPVYPLDGGRILLALLSLKGERKRAYFIMRIVSAVTGVVSVALFVASAFYSLNICFLTVGLFMLVSAFIPDNRAKYYALFAVGGRRERIKRPLEQRRFAVSGKTRLAELCKILDADRYTVFEVYDDNFKNIGVADEHTLSEIIKKYGYEESIENILRNRG